jgi:hypothetical protein
MNDNPPYICPYDLRTRIRISRINRPDPRASTDIEDSLWVFEGCEMVFSVEELEEDFMVEV